MFSEIHFKSRLISHENMKCEKSCFKLSPPFTRRNPFHLDRSGFKFQGHRHNSYFIAFHTVLKRTMFTSVMIALNCYHLSFTSQVIQSSAYFVFRKTLKNLLISKLNVRDCVFFFSEKFGLIWQKQRGFMLRCYFGYLFLSFNTYFFLH